jgi:hypothetical protein
VVGIDSQVNLVRALATAKSAPPTIAASDDHTICDQLLAELRGKNWVDVSSAYTLSMIGPSISGSPMTRPEG